MPWVALLTYLRHYRRVQGSQSAGGQSAGGPGPRQKVPLRRLCQLQTPAHGGHTSGEWRYTSHTACCRARGHNHQRLQAAQLASILHLELDLKKTTLKLGIFILMPRILWSLVYCEHLIAEIFVNAPRCSFDKAVDHSPIWNCVLVKMFICDNG